MTCADAVLDGTQIATLAAIDRIFGGWAREIGACERAFPATIPVQVLERAGYFRAFPQLAMFAVGVSREEGRLRAFAQRTSRESGVAELELLEPVRDALPPAACHHVYAWLQGRALERSTLVTTRATCFRREERCEPLRRQRGFQMREIVCVGGEGEVEAFLADAREWLDALFDRARLPVAFAPATDAFFAPETSPGYVMQKVLPLKIEMRIDGLAIGSLNRHGTHFGRAFDIRRGAQAARSACVAFGLERWLDVLARHGLDSARRVAGLRGGAA